MTLSDPFFGKIGLQLIYPPPESRAALAKAVGGANVHSDIPGADQALDMTKAWVRNILRKEYQPPQETVYLPIPRETGLCDVVRANYQSGGLELEIAQTFSMFNVTVKHLEVKPTEDSAARAERVAKLLLNVSVISFQTVGTDGAFVYGKQKAPYDPFECDWSEILRWWCEGDRVGFITVKTTKGPARAVVGPGEESNVRWFDFYTPK